MSFNKIVFSLIGFVITLNCCSQSSNNWSIPIIDSTTIANLNIVNNEILNSNSLEKIFKKLCAAKYNSNEKAIIVHIGDSHIQADMMSGAIRNYFQNYFGNAGRGLIFPYQVAKSNAPSDIISTTQSSWRGKRITKRDSTLNCGISAFGIQSQAANPSFNFELRTINGYTDTFDKVTFFTSENVQQLQIDYNENQKDSIEINASKDFYSLDLKASTSGFKLTFPTDKTIEFYGASIEKKNTNGVIYHSIGANGATFSNYNETPLFWKQVKNLNADCYVISLGTNEAQDQNLTAEEFLESVKLMVENIKLVSPNAVVIFTTPPVSYFRKLKPNPELAIIANALISYSNENNIAYWDLFSNCNGLKGCYKWKKAKLLRSDLVHFSKEGYVLQANLFTDAFSKAWNEFLSKN